MCIENDNFSVDYYLLLKHLSQGAFLYDEVDSANLLGMMYQTDPPLDPKKVLPTVRSLRYYTKVGEFGKPNPPASSLKLRLPCKGRGSLKALPLRGEGLGRGHTLG